MTLPTLAPHLTEHPIWPDLLPYVHIEPYARDGGHEHPRHRIEVRRMPAELLAAALAVEVACCACGNPMHPIRLRRGAPSGAYYAASCPLDVSLPCSRGPEARADYTRMVGEVPPTPPVQASLF